MNKHASDLIFRLSTNTRKTKQIKKGNNKQRGGHNKKTRYPAGSECKCMYSQGNNFKTDYDSIREADVLCAL